jgi:subtilisin family serine protease
VGVAPEASLLALKACWQLYADRDDARCNSFTLAQALASAIELHAHIINLSIVGPTDPLLAALINKAQNSGIVVVGAADADNHSLFPSRLPNVIGVSAMEQPTVMPQVINAPGRDVLTLRPGGHYDFSSGSSIATGEVSGAVALLLASSASNSLSSDQLRQLLLHSTEISSIDKFSSINACVALSTLLKQPGCNHQGMESGAAAIRQLQ